MAGILILHDLVALAVHDKIHQLRNIPGRDLGAGVFDPKRSPRIANNFCTEILWTTLDQL